MARVHPTFTMATRASSGHAIRRTAKTVVIIQAVVIVPMPVVLPRAPVATVSAAVLKPRLTVRLIVVAPPQKRVVMVFVDRVKHPPLVRLIAPGHRHVRQIFTTARPAPSGLVI